MNSLRGDAVRFPLPLTSWPSAVARRGEDGPCTETLGAAILRTSIVSITVAIAVLLPRPPASISISFFLSRTRSSPDRDAPVGVPARWFPGLTVWLRSISSSCILRPMGCGMRDRGGSDAVGGALEGTISKNKSALRSSFGQEEVNIDNHEKGKEEQVHTYPYKKCLSV